MKINEEFARVIYGCETLTIPKYMLINEAGEILSRAFILPSNPDFEPKLAEIFADQGAKK